MPVYFNEFALMALTYSLVLSLIFFHSQVVTYNTNLVNPALPIIQQKVEVKGSG